MRLLVSLAAGLMLMASPLLLPGREAPAPPPASSGGLSIFSEGEPLLRDLAWRNQRLASAFHSGPCGPEGIR